MKTGVHKRIISVMLAGFMVLSTVFVAEPQYFSAENASAAKPQMKITWFDVGAGDSIYLRLPDGSSMLIDGGLKSKGPEISAKLKKMNVNTVDYLVSTHPDADHVGGLQSIFRNFRIKNFYYPADAAYDTQTAREVIRLASAEKCRIIHPAQNSTINGGHGCVLRFVQSSRNYSSDNEDSLALFADYGSLEVLFAGDNEKGSQDAIAKHNVDILMLPHHGSRYATTSSFIRRTDPEHVVVSTDGKKYGHPHKDVFTRLDSYDRNIKAYRTDSLGDITVTCNYSSWSINKKGTLVRYCKGGSSSGGGSSSSGSGGNTGQTPVSSYVFTTKTGSRYHITRSCRGLSNASAIYKVTRKTAVSRGLTPCRICAQ